MSARLQSFRKRLTKIEAQLAPIVCNCKLILIVNDNSESAIAEAREALRNRPCPAHGLNHRTRLIIIESVPSLHEPEVVSTVVA